MAAELTAHAVRLTAAADQDAAGRRALREIHHFTSMVERLDEMGCAHPGAGPGLPRAVEAAAMVGDREVCARLTDRLTRQADALRMPLTDAHICAARGQVALLHGHAEQAAADLANATAAYLRCEYRFDAGRAGLSLARAWLRCGRRSNARAAAGAAHEEFTTAGAPHWVAFADDLLARAQAGTPGGSLTGTERQIASLVTAGLLNREIAVELFISISTVEAHLTRIYRKLGLRHRTELTNYIHAKG